jgi:repressor LexA
LRTGCRRLPANTAARSVPRGQNFAFSKPYGRKTNLKLVEPNSELYVRIVVSALSPSQKQLLDFILSRWEAGEVLPSSREITNRFGWSSPRAASDALDVLKRKGFLANDVGSSRKYRLTEQAVGLPVLGEIPAGFPVDGLESHEERFTLNPASFGVRDRKSAFFLRVRGDSMIGRRIFDGDLVLVERTARPGHLSIVAALIDQQVTLKTLIHEEGNAAWLRSENPTSPDLIPLQDLEIQGVARSVIRPLKP